MEPKDYWQLFLDSGVPEYYLLFQHFRRGECINVSEDQGIGPSGDHVSGAG